MPGGPNLPVPSMSPRALDAAEPFQREYHAADQFSPERIAF